MIKFGTSGWRDIIAEGFTYEGVRIVSQAIADYLKTEEFDKESNHIIVGYDTRFMSEDFAKASAEVLAANGFEIHYSVEDVPTPVISYEIIRSNACGGINITASHNPYKYNGIKFSPAWGGPALPKTTSKVEENCKKIKKDLSVIKTMPFNEGIEKGLIKKRDFKTDYLKRIEQLVDMDAIKESGIRVVVDVMNGAGRGYLDTILQYHGIPTIALNVNRDPYFRGHHPEPCTECLGDAIEFVKDNDADIALATDGDADRFGIIDKDGNYITANEIIAVLLYHLVKNRGYKGIAARSVMTSSFIDAVAAEYGIELRETPVGFKYIGDILMKENLVIGGEESGGLTIHDHIPEKDGILACLLVVEMIAMFGKSIKEIKAEIEEKVGKFYTDRKNYRLAPDAMARVKDTLSKNPPKAFGKFEVRDIVTLDGHKFLFDNSAWMGIRLSGTEPIVRCYIEAKNEDDLKELLIAGDAVINSI